MSRVIIDLLSDNLPAGRDFVILNLSAMAETREKPQVASPVILLITSTGVFLPLEVALNLLTRRIKCGLGPFGLIEWDWE